MNPLSHAQVKVTPSLRPHERRAWRWWLGTVMAMMLAACGGGGEAGGGGGSEMAMAAVFEPGTASMPDAAEKPESSPTLLAQPISMVNETSAGDQKLRAIGALSDGGYTVAWLSGTTLYMQRYDSAGNKSGTETVVPLVLDPRDTALQIFASSSVAVLSDGSVVVAYATTRSTEEPMSPIVIESGVYIQRFDQNGAQTLSETTIASVVGGDPRRLTTFQLVQVLPMPEGAYVVGWGTFSVSATVGNRTFFSTQRIDDQNRPVGVVVNFGATLNPKKYQIVADATGGYTAYWSGERSDFSPTGLMVTHYDANQQATEILTGWAGSALLLPLEDGRYVLYTSDAGGVYRQFLDTAGAPVGERTSVWSMPVSAQLLADGSYVVFWTGTEGTSVQRFDANGEHIGDLLTIQAGSTQPAAVALVEGGFAAAWTAPGANTDLDVYTQRFIEATYNQRKACLANAKVLRGQERKAFIMACLRQPPRMGQ